MGPYIRGDYNRMYVLIIRSGAYTWEGGGGGLISGSLCYDPFVEKLAKGSVRLSTTVIQLVLPIELRNVLN